MIINTKKYFEEAKKRNFDLFSLSYSVSTETSVEVFNVEVEAQQIGTSQDVSGQGLIDGKIGSYATDVIDKNTPVMMMDAICESGKFGREEKIDHFYGGGKRYRKAAVSFADFKKASLKELRDAALALCKKIQEKDKRLAKVTVSLSMTESETFKTNTLGLKCKEKKACFVGGFEIVAEDEDKEPRTGGEMFFSFHSLEDLIAEGEKKIDSAIHEAIDFFKTGPCKSKKYKAVLSPSAVSDLMAFFMSQLNAKSVHKHLSVFENKVGQEIVSKKLTVLHTPHDTALEATSYDADGYPTQDFTLIQRGVLKTYFHSVETAKEENISSNGCASGIGNAGPFVLRVKPGNKNKEELFSKVKNGIYITTVSGLNSGINAQTLDYSLPCKGYLIKDGKVSQAVSMIVCAGNLKDLFENVTDIASDVEYHSGIFTPSMLIKDFSISGK